MRRLISCIALILCAAAIAKAETRNVIYQWNDTYNIGDDPTDPDSNYLTIVQGGVAWSRIQSVARLCEPCSRAMCA
jgi:hypothetical protein